MTKTKLLSQITKDPDRRILLARILDRKELAEKKKQPTWSSFLSPEEQTAVEDLLRHMGVQEAVFWGGYPEAERKICFVFAGVFGEGSGLGRGKGSLSCGFGCGDTVSGEIT